MRNFRLFVATWGSASIVAPEKKPPATNKNAATPFLNLRIRNPTKARVRCDSEWRELMFRYSLLNASLAMSPIHTRSGPEVGHDNRGDLARRSQIDCPDHVTTIQAVGGVRGAHGESCATRSDFPPPPGVGAVLHADVSGVRTERRGAPEYVTTLTDAGNARCRVPVFRGATRHRAVESLVEPLHLAAVDKWRDTLSMASPLVDTGRANADLECSTVRAKGVLLP